MLRLDCPVSILVICAVYCTAYLYCHSDMPLSAAAAASQCSQFPHHYSTRHEPPPASGPSVPRLPRPAGPPATSPPGRAPSPAPAAPPPNTSSSPPHWPSRARPAPGMWRSRRHRLPLAGMGAASSAPRHGRPPAAAAARRQCARRRWRRAPCRMT